MKITVELVLEDLRFNFLRQPGWQIRQFEGAVSGTDQAADLQAEMRHHLADFAILAFFERDGEPHVRTGLSAFHPGFYRPVIHAVDRDASCEPGKIGGLYRAMHAHAVAFLASAEAGYITGCELPVNGGMYMG